MSITIIEMPKAKAATTNNVKKEGFLNTLIAAIVSL